MTRLFNVEKCTDASLQSASRRFIYLFFNLILFCFTVQTLKSAWIQSENDKKKPVWAKPKYSYFSSCYTNKILIGLQPQPTASRTTHRPGLQDNNPNQQNHLQRRPLSHPISLCCSTRFSRYLLIKCCDLAVGLNYPTFPQSVCLLFSCTYWLPAYPRMLFNSPHGRSVTLLSSAAGLTC